jgi:hypothetical protein
MNMKKNAVLLLLVTALFAFSAAPAFAQDLPEPFCGDLDEADCEILLSAQDAQLSLSSYSSTVDATTMVAGLPGLPADELTFEWSQDTVLEMDPELTMAMAELQMQGPEAMMENMEELADLTVEFYQTLGVDAMIDFTMPAEIADILSAQAGIEVPAELALHLIMKDGFAYIATEGLSFLGPQITDMGEWIGIDLASAVEMGFQQSLESDDPAQQAQMAQSLGLSSMLNSEEVRGLLEEFVIVERLDDADVDGTEVAVFETGFDFAGFLASPGFWELVSANLDMINSMSETQITEEELQQAQMALTFLGPALLEGLELSSTSSLGAEDFFPYAQTVSFNWDLSGLLRFAASTGAVPAGMGEDALISLEIDATNSDFNDTDEIVAPEDATIIPLEGMESSQ